MKYYVLVIFSLLSFNLIAQDIIIKRNGDEIKSKILEITNETIKYKKFEFQDGPIRNINISDVFMVIYENGEREKFTTTENLNSKEVVQKENLVITESQNSTEITKEKVSINDYNGDYSMFGIGYGNSYGGAGLRLQWRSGDNQGFGMHGGIGYFPNAKYLASIGMKFFFYKDLYINVQYGRTGWEEYTGYYTINNYSYSESESHVLKGYSFMAGGDWTWGRKVGYGFNFGIGITHNKNVEYFQDMTNTVAIDLGFIVKY